MCCILLLLRSVVRPYTETLSTSSTDKLNPKKKIYLGGLFPDHVPAFDGIGIGAKLAVDAVNADDGVLSSHELELVVDGSDGSDAVASYLRLQNDNTKPLTGEDGRYFSPRKKLNFKLAE